MDSITIHLGTIVINKFGWDSIHSFHLCLIWNSADAVKGEIGGEEEEKRMSNFIVENFSLSILPFWHNTLCDCSLLVLQHQKLLIVFVVFQQALLT